MEKDYIEIIDIDVFSKKYLGDISKEVFKRMLDARFKNIPLKVYYSEYNEILEKQRLRDFDKKYKNDIAEAYRKAKSLENIDNDKAIGLYESIRDRKRNFDVLDRLIILYRKTNQKEKEIESINFLIEEEENSEYNKMRFLQLKYLDHREEIEKCYEEYVPFINPEFGFQTTFRKKIIRLKERLRKLENQ